MPIPNTDFKYMLIDSNSIFHALYSVEKTKEPDMREFKLKDKDGAIYKKPLNVNAMRRYVRFLATLRKEFPNARFIHVFDGDNNKAYRQNIDPNYKINSQSDVELKESVQALMGMLKVLQNPVYNTPNYEADDVIVSMAVQIAPHAPVAVFSNDKDLSQVISYAPERINIVKTKADETGKKRICTLGREEIFEDYGIYPEQFYEYLALKGDKSDNISGIKGIGEVNAKKLLNTFGTIQNALEYIGKIEQNKKDRLEPDFNGEIIERKEEIMSQYNYTILSDPNFGKEFLKQTQLAFALPNLTIDSLKEKMQELERFANPKAEEITRQILGMGDNIDRHFNDLTQIPSLRR